MKSLRDRITELLNQYYKEADVDGLLLSCIDATEKSILVSRLEHLLQLHNNPFTPPDFDPYFETDEMGWRAATLKFHQATTNKTFFYNNEVLWVIEACFVNPIAPNRFDVRITLVNSDMERQTLNVSQFVSFLKQSMEVPTINPDACA